MIFSEGRELKPGLISARQTYKHPLDNHSKKRSTFGCLQTSDKDFRRTCKSPCFRSV